MTENEGIGIQEGKKNPYSSYPSMKVFPPNWDRDPGGNKGVVLTDLHEGLSNEQSVDDLLTVFASLLSQNVIFLKKRIKLGEAGSKTLQVLL